MRSITSNKLASVVGEETGVTCIAESLAEPLSCPAAPLPRRLAALLSRSRPLVPLCPSVPLPLCVPLSGWHDSLGTYFLVFDVVVAACCCVC